nr:MAG TPA: hypothetical protein [Caudoviricetes sp.]
MKAASKANLSAQAQRRIATQDARETRDRAEGEGGGAMKGAQA